MQTSPVHQGPPTTEIEKRWNRSCFNYSTFTSKTLRASALQMFDYIQAQKADSILEMGCGDGTATVDFALMKKADAKLVCNDLARNMCIMTVQRLRRADELSKTGKIVGYRDEIFSKPVDVTQLEWTGETISVPELNTTIIHGDNENLGAHIPDESVDALIASLSLHIVSTPMNMLKESIRVLKPNGRAVYSVWGQKENSYQFVNVEKTKEKFGIPASNKRNSWHMNNRTELVQLVEQAGFSEVEAWEQFIPVHKEDPETRRLEYRHLLEVEWPVELKEKLPEAVEYLYSLQDEVYETLKMPVGLNLLYVAGRKANQTA